MKKLSLVLGCLITTNSFAEILILKTEHTVSPGFKGNIEVIRTEKTLSPEEISQIKNSEVNNLSKTLTANVENAFGVVNQKPYL